MNLQFSIKSMKKIMNTILSEKRNLNIILEIKNMQSDKD